MGPDILALDVGTSGLKAGVFGPDLDEHVVVSRSYEIRVGARPRRMCHLSVVGRIVDACAEIRPHLDDVGVIALSVTTPGLTPMAADGRALGPAILMLDGRAHEQAAAIRAAVGEERFLAEACNLPVSGGSSLASILWIRDDSPRSGPRPRSSATPTRTSAKRLTGEWAIDPSTTSITGSVRHRPQRPDLERGRTRGGRHRHEPPAAPDAVVRSGGQILPAVADELGCRGTRRALRRQRRLAGGLVGRPVRARRRQHHQRHHGHRQRLHRAAGRVARLQRPLPRLARPLAHVLRAQHRRRGLRLVLAHLLSGDERR